MELGRSVLLVVFGAEERGIVGSSAFVGAAGGADRIAMVNIDMIGRKLVDQLWLAPLSSCTASPATGLASSARRDAPRSGASSTTRARRPACAPSAPRTSRLRARRRRAPDGGAGDNVPFERAGIVSVFFGAGESDDYHKPSDVIDKLDFPLMARRGRAILGTVIGLSRAPRCPDGAVPEIWRNISATGRARATLGTACRHVR